MISRHLRLVCMTLSGILGCFILAQDHLEIIRISSYLRASLSAEYDERNISVSGRKVSTTTTTETTTEDANRILETRAMVDSSYYSDKNKTSTSDTSKSNSPTNNATALQVLLGDAHMMDRTIQAIALSHHHPGRLVAIVNVMHLKCKERQAYLMSTDALVGVKIEKGFDSDTGDSWVHGHATSGEWIRDIHTTVEINVPLDVYEFYKRQGNGVRVTVRDLVQNTDHTIPLLVDPSPQSFLSGLVWINKSRRFYEGRKSDIPNGKKKKGHDRRREAVGTQLGPAPRNDSYTLTHLLPWIQYHRQQGVEHIYIIDQENNLTIPNFALTPPFLTYIRAPYAHMDYFVDNCNLTHPELKLTRSRISVLQHILDTLVLRMTTSEWMIVTDLDEFIMAGPESIVNGTAPSSQTQSLPQLVKEFAHQHCDGLPKKPHYRNPMWEQWQNLRCVPTKRPVFELQFYQAKIANDNNMTLSSDKDDYWALTKTIFHAPFVSRSRVHFAYPLHDTTVSTKVLPHRGFLAHFRGGAPSEELLQLAPQHATKLKHLSYWPKGGGGGSNGRGGSNLGIANRGVKANGLPKGNAKRTARLKAATTRGGGSARTVTKPTIRVATTTVTAFAPTSQARTVSTDDEKKSHAASATVARTSTNKKIYTDTKNTFANTNTNTPPDSKMAWQKEVDAFKAYFSTTNAVGSETTTSTTPTTALNAVSILDMKKSKTAVFKPSTSRKSNVMESGQIGIGFTSGNEKPTLD